MSQTDNLDEPIVTDESTGGGMPPDETDKSAEAVAVPATPADEGDDDEVQVPKKQRGFQKRISELTSRIGMYEDLLEKQMALTKKLLQQPGAQPASVPVPKVADKPLREEDYDSTEAYMEALAEKTSERKFQAKEAARIEQEKLDAIKRQQDEIRTQGQRAVQATAKKFKDFDPDVFGRSVDVSTPMAEEILDSDVKEEILYFLYQNPDESRRIAMLDPRKAAREMAKIEARIENAKNNPPTKRVTEAPTPISTVKGDGGKIEIKPEDMTTGDYIAWRNKQEFGR